MSPTLEDASAPLNKTKHHCYRWLPWIMCAIAALFYCYEYLLRISPNLMKPELMQAFGISSAALIGSISAFYFVAYTPMQLPVGVLMDKYGPRRVLTFAVFCCALGTIIFSLCQQLAFQSGMFVNAVSFAKLGRFLIGFGSAFAFVGVLKIATIWLPPDRFAFISGLATTLGMLGAVFGQNMLGSLIESIGWQNTLLYSAIFGMALIPITWMLIRDEPKSHLPNVPDTTGAWDVSYSQLLVNVCSVLTNPRVILNGLIGMLIIMPTTVFAEFWGRDYLVLVNGLTSKESNVAISMVFLGWAVGSPIMGYISDKIHRRKPPLFIGLIAVFFIFYLLIFGPNVNSNQVYGLLFLLGFFSSSEIICFAIARENVQVHLAGTAIALTNFFVVCAGFFQYPVGKILDHVWNGEIEKGLPLYTVENYQSALVFIPFGIGLAIILLFFVKETYAKSLEEA